MVSLLESFKKTGLVASKDDAKSETKKGNENVSNITYELYYAPEHAKLNQLAQAAAIEKRIDYLETLIGNNPDKLVCSVFS